MLINGNLNPVTLGHALVTAKDIIAYAKNPTNNTPEARRVTSMGITDSAFIGEINNEVYQELIKVVAAMEGKTQAAMWDTLKAVGLTVKETYAMMDVVYKIANFYHQANIVLPAYYEAGGLTKEGKSNPSREYIDREAADIVNDSVPTK